MHGALNKIYFICNYKKSFKEKVFSQTNPLDLA